MVGVKDHRTKGSYEGWSIRRRGGGSDERVTDERKVRDEMYE